MSSSSDHRNLADSPQQPTTSSPSISIDELLEVLNALPLDKLAIELDKKYKWTEGDNKYWTLYQLGACITERNTRNVNAENDMSSTDGKSKELSPAIIGMLTKILALYRKVECVLNYPEFLKSEGNWLKRFEVILSAANNRAQHDEKELTADRLPARGCLWNDQDYFGQPLDSIYVPVQDFFVGADPYYTIAGSKKLSKTKLNTAKSVAPCNTIPSDHIPPKGRFKGQTPVFAAALYGNEEFIRDAIEYDHPDCFNPVAFGPFIGMTPLAVALFKSHKDPKYSIIATLLAKHAVQNKERQVFQSHQGMIEGLSSLDIAIITNHALVCEKLLEHYVKQHLLINKDKLLDAADRAFIDKDRVSFLQKLYDLASSYMSSNCKQIISEQAKKLNITIPIVKVVDKIEKKSIIKKSPLHHNHSGADTKPETNKVVPNEFEQIKEELLTLSADIALKLEHLSERIDKLSSNAAKIQTARAAAVAIDQKYKDLKIKIDTLSGKMESMDDDLKADSLKTFVEQLEGINRRAAELKKKFKNNCKEIKSLLASQDDDGSDIELDDAESDDENPAETQPQVGTQDDDSVVSVKDGNELDEDHLNESQDETTNDPQSTPESVSSGSQTPPVSVQSLEYDPFSEVGFIKYNKNEQDDIKKSVVKISEKHRKNKGKNQHKPIDPLTPSQRDLIKIIQLRLANLEQAYEKFKQIKPESKYDSYYHLLISVIEGELLVIFESLREFEDKSQRKVFTDPWIAKQLRNISKYCYAQFIYGDIDELKALVEFTLDAVKPCVAKIQSQSKYETLAPESNLYQRLMTMKQRESEPKDDLSVAARFQTAIQFLSTTIHNENKLEHMDRSYLTMLTHAQVTCCGQIGLLAKQLSLVNPQQRRLGYGAKIKNLIKSHHANQNPNRKFTNFESPLLDYLSLCYIGIDGKNACATVIGELSVYDMVQLLMEICNLKSHKVEDPLLLVNPKTTFIFRLIVTRMCQLQTEEGHRPLIEIGNSHHTIKFKAEEFQFQMNSAHVIPSHAKADPLFVAINHLLTDIGRRPKVEDHEQIVSLLLQYATSFEAFKSKYLYHAQSIELFTGIKNFLQEIIRTNLVHAPRNS